MDRTKFIGGTDVAALIGRHPYKTALDVWLEKTGRVPPPDENAAMEWGKRLEPAVAQAFSEKTGLQIVKAEPFVDGFLGASPDYYIEPGGVLEVKTSGRVGFFGRHMDPDAVPPHYLCQLVWYGGLSKRIDPLYIAVLIRGNDYRHYPVEFDPILFAEMRMAAEKFWRENIECDVEPAENMVV